jgi:hypothetical protein
MVCDTKAGVADARKESTMAFPLRPPGSKSHGPKHPPKSDHHDDDKRCKPRKPKHCKRHKPKRRKRCD